MNGWIETRNPDVFAEVGRDDVVLRTSTLGANLVFGNGSMQRAAVYLAGNNVGVHKVPDADVALDVDGRVRFNNVEFDEGEIACQFSNSILSVSSVGLRMSMSMSMSNATTAVELSYDGKVLASTLIARDVYKTSSSHRVSISRIFSRGVDVTGFEHAFGQGVKWILLQNRVLGVREITPAVSGRGGAHIELLGDALAPGTLTLGSCELQVLDASLMEMSRFGGLLAETELDRTTAKTARAELVVDEHGREALRLRLQEAATEEEDCPRRQQQRLFLRADPADELCLFEVSSVVVQQQNSEAVYELVCVDSTTRPSDAYPATLAALIGNVGVGVELTWLKFPTLVHELRGIDVHFQASRIVFDCTRRLDDLSTLPSGVIRALALRWSRDSKEIRVVPEVSRRLNDKVVAELYKPQTSMASGAACSLRVELLGPQLRVVSAEYSGPDELCLELEGGCSESDDDFEYLYVLSGTNSTLFRLRNSLRGHQTRTLFLSFLNASDAARHVELIADSTVVAVRFSPESRTRISGASRGASSVEFTDAIVAKSTLRVDGAIDAPSVRADELRVGVVKARQGCLEVDAQQVRFAGGISSSEFAVSDRGVAIFPSVVSDRYLDVVEGASLAADPLRRFVQLYDYVVGEFVSTVTLPALVSPMGATCAFVDGARYSCRRVANGGGTELFVEMGSPPPRLFDAAAAHRVLFCRDAALAAASLITMEFKLVVLARHDDEPPRTITIDANVLRFVDQLVSLRRLNEDDGSPFPKSVHLLTSCEPLPGGLFKIELETLSSDPFFSENASGCGSSWTMTLLRAPFPIVVRESVDGVVLRADEDASQCVSLVPLSQAAFAMPPSCVESYHVSTLSFPIHRQVETLEVDRVRRTANGLDFRVSPHQRQHQQQRMYTTTHRTEVRATLRGACATLVEARAIGANEAVVKMRLHARVDFKGFPVVFVGGRPWRLITHETEAYQATLRLRRLAAPRPALGDLLDCAVGASLYILPCGHSTSDDDSASPLEVDSVLISNRFEIRASDDHMILEDSLALSKGDAYARFLKDVFVQGNMVAETISHVSDRAFKREITPRPPQADLAVLRALNVYDYDFLDRDAGRRREFGVVADELEALLPEAVQEVNGFVANVYSKASFGASRLIIDGSHAATISNSSSETSSALLQLRSAGGGWFEVRVAACSEGDGKTFVTMQPDAAKLANGDYFVYGTWTRYKVANTTHLLMACINAVKHLLGVSPPNPPTGGPPPQAPLCGV